MIAAVKKFLRPLKRFWKDRARLKAIAALPPARGDNEFVSADHLLATAPCTRYWHYERRGDVDGQGPPGIPRWFKRFDWLIGWKHGWADPPAYPASVFCHPEWAGALLGFLKQRWPDGAPSPAILVLGGEDTKLSTQPEAVLEGLRAYFTDIFYEAKDIEKAGVKLMPIGLTEFYLRGVEAHFQRLLAAPCAQKSPKILAAWGRWWPQLNDEIDDRASAAAFAADNPLVEYGTFDREEWLEKLHAHRFMLCPLGNGVQAPKMLEALMLSCIPIMTESVAARELEARGLSILVVSAWSDINEALLAGAADRLAERVETCRAQILSPDDWWRICFPQSPDAAAVNDVSPPGRPG